MGIEEPFFTLTFSRGFTVSLHQLIVKSIMSIMLLGFLLLELLLKDINILVGIFCTADLAHAVFLIATSSQPCAQSNVPLDRYTMSRLTYVFN